MKFQEKRVEQVVEKPSLVVTTREVPREVQQIVEVPLETIKQSLRTVEKVVEQPVEFETIIEKRVEYIVEKVIQVPVEKVIEVPINIYITKPIFKEVIIEEEVPIEIEVFEFEEVSCDEEDQSIDDIAFHQEIEQRREELRNEQREQENLRAELEEVQRELNQIRLQEFQNLEKENIRLVTTLSELQCLYDNEKIFNKFLERKRKRLQNVVHE